VADFFDSLDEKHIAFINEQKIYFVATAANEGSINLSPKGMDTFAVIDNNTVAYLDLTGSGNETAAHLYENARMTIMMCSFDKHPLIFRMYGKGKVISQNTEEWKKWKYHFDDFPGMRQIIALEIDNIQTSCGYAVPTAENFQERRTLVRWAEKKGDTGIKEYWKEKNITSLDGLPTHLLTD